MTRLFREGRTETVRPCTIESSQWVKAMHDQSVSVSRYLSSSTTSPLVAPFLINNFLFVFFLRFNRFLSLCMWAADRARNGFDCLNWPASSTNEATRTPCAEKASIVTCFASTSFPNTSKSTHPSSRRCSASRGDCRRRRRRTDRRRNSIWPNIPTASRPAEVSGPSPTTATASLTSSPVKISSFSTFPQNAHRPKRFVHLFQCHPTSSSTILMTLYF